MEIVMTKPKKTIVSEEDSIRDVAAPAAGAVVRPRSAGTSRKASCRRKENSPELERIIGTTVQAILLAAQNEVPGVMQWHDVGQALHEGEVQLENTETTCVYGTNFVRQVAGRCGLYPRKAHHFLDLATTFTREQAAQLAQAGLPFRQLRSVLAFIGGDEGREARIATLLARIPKDGTTTARRSFVKWLDGQHCKRNPLMQADRFAVIGANGEIHGRLTTEARARALAHGRRIMQFKPAAN